MPGLPELAIEPMRCALGLEGTVEAYIGHLVLVFREVKRCLRDDGVVWTIIGDSYGGEGGNLLMVPHRLALALQGDGWVVRNDVVWSKCLSGGTMVYAKTQKGEMPMTVKDMVRLDPSTVQLWDGEKWNQAHSWEETPRPEHPLEIELRNGQRIGCTPDHKWPVEGLGLLVKAKDLRPGLILKSAKLPRPEHPRMPNALDDDDIGWFVGMYLAEGHIDKKKIGISSHIKETNRLDRIDKIARAYDGYVWHYQSSENGMVIMIHSPVLLGILETYISGKYAQGKHLNVRCWKRSNKFLDALLRGYLEGDGHKDGRRWRIGFCENDSLTADLRTIAARLGYSLRLKRCKHTMGDRKFPGWRGSVALDPSYRRTNDYEIIAIRKSRARKFWMISLKDEPHLFALTCGVLTGNCNPMPESVRGWTWTRCRVKTANLDYQRAGSRTNKDRNDAGVACNLPYAQYTDCPGCDKCEATDGYVLRRGSWRHTRAQETVLMLVKGMQYWSDQEKVREALAVPVHKPGNILHKDKISGPNDRGGHSQWEDTLTRGWGNSSGRNPRSVLTVTGESYKGSHYAVFPTKLIAPLIRATCPAKCCPVCGAGYAPVVEKETTFESGSGKAGNHPDGKYKEYEGTGLIGKNLRMGPTVTANVLGYRASCTCGVTDHVPGILLDPFLGSGTCGAVAKELGLRWVGLDLAHEYLDSQAKVRTQTGAPSDALDGLPMFAEER